MSSQLAFEFDAAPAVFRPTAKMLREEAAIQAEDDRARDRTRFRESMAGARAYWRVGMVTSLPCFATVLESSARYTQMLPGVVESIEGDKASVRIYAAPEYGYTIEEYPLHKKLAVDIPLTDLGRYHGNEALERIVANGLLETGDPEVAAAVRLRTNYRRMV